MNKKEMAAECKAELEVAKAATNRESILEFGWGCNSVWYKTESGESMVVSFKYAFNSTRFYKWIDAYFAD